MIFDDFCAVTYMYSAEIHRLLATSFLENPKFAHHGVLNLHVDFANAETVLAPLYL